MKKALLIGLVAKMDTALFERGQQYNLKGLMVL